MAHSGDSGDARPRALPTLHVLSSQVVLVLEVQDQADSVVRSLGGQGLLWPTVGTVEGQRLLWPTVGTVEGQGLLWPTVGTVEGQGLLSNFKIAPYTKVVTAISARVE